MNNIKSFMYCSLIVFAAFGCKDKDVEILGGGVWEIQSVTHETKGDLTSYYSNFSISFKEEKLDNFDGTYVLTNGGLIFPEASGMYTFNDKSSVLEFDSGMSIKTQVTETTLTFTFSADPVAGRVKGLAGEYVFVLVKN